MTEYPANIFSIFTLLLLLLISVPNVYSQQGFDLEGEVHELFNQQERVLQLCGPHPLQAILDKVEGKLDHDSVVKLLATISQRAPKLWKAYLHALMKYASCKMMVTSGTLGR